MTRKLKCLLKLYKLELQSTCGVKKFAVINFFQV